jgi:hypothetical protein
MKLMDAFNAMSPQSISAFVKQSIMQVPGEDGPEGSGRHLYVTMPLRGRDADDIDDLLLTLTDADERADSTLAFRTFIVTMRLAQQLIDEEPQDENPRTGYRIVSADRPD